MDLLKKYRIPFAAGCTGSRQQVIAAAGRIGFPIVLKVASEKILHKTDVGGVRTGIMDRAELEAEINSMAGRLGCDSFMVQRQETGKEVIVGMKRDAQFGPVILFGMGGVLVEIFKDVALRIAPLTRRDAQEMIKQVKAYQILKGYRGEPAVNTEAVADIILKLSLLAMKEQHITEIDFNPVIVNQKYAVVVDARII